MRSEGRKWLCVVLVGATVASQVGCRRRERASVPTESGASRHIQAKTPPKVDDRLVAANTAFGLKLLQKLMAEKPKENVFISPASVALALAMTYNGAAGETKTAMAKTMGVEALSIAELNAANAALTAGLQDPEEGMELSIANSIWVDKGFPVQPAFLQANRKSYGAEVTNLALAAPDSAQRINSWVSDKTRGKIPSIVTPQDLQQQLALILINAAYFKAEWKDPFNTNLTHTGPFTTASGTKKQVPLMFRSDEMAYLQGKTFQAVRLPYGSGRFDMRVFLPAKRTGLMAFCRGITPTKWAAWTAALGDRKGSLKLPRFKAEGEFGLNQALAAMGMGVAFTPGRADLTGMATATPGGLWIGAVRHKTYVDVNEEGTEAAAVTAVPATPGLERPELTKPFEMFVNRPFLCAICDSATGTILFMGAIVDPKA